jgi:hypothetical protein
VIDRGNGDDCLAYRPLNAKRFMLELNSDLRRRLEAISRCLWRDLDFLAFSRKWDVRSILWVSSTQLQYLNHVSSTHIHTENRFDAKYPESNDLSPAIREPAAAKPEDASTLANKPVRKIWDWSNNYVCVGRRGLLRKPSQAIGG